MMTSNAPLDKRTVYRAARWSAVARYVAQLLRFLSFLILARLLTPGDFGVLAMAWVVLGFVGILHTLGFNAAIIQRKQITSSFVSSLFFANLVFCVLLAVLVAAAGPLIARALSEPRIVPVQALLSLTIVIGSLYTIPAALLTRNLRFGALAAGQLASAVALSATAITLALNGCGVYALVWGSILGELLTSAVLVLSAGWRPKLHFKFGEVRSVLGFGMNLTGVRVFDHFLGGQTPTIIIGALLGVAPLGLYTAGHRFAVLCRQSLSEVVASVLLPTLSRLNQEEARFARVYVQAIGIVSFLVLPAMLGLALIAEPLVQVLLGEKWLAAAPLIPFAAILGIALAVERVVNVAFVARGRTDLHLKWEVLFAALAAIGCVAGIRYGVIGAAAGYSIARLVLLFPRVLVVVRIVPGLTVGALWKEVCPYLVVAAAMGCWVRVCWVMLSSSGFGAPAGLFLTVLLGVAFYSMGMFLLSPPAFGHFVRIVFPAADIASAEKT